MFETFELTENHIKLIQRMYVEFCNDGYEGAPAVDLKRPYGNSWVEGDVAEILGYQDYIDAANNDDDDTREYEDATQEILKLHRETGTALQIIVSTKSFEPGTYGRPSKYNKQYWVKIDD